MYVHFLLLEAFSLATSIFKYSSTSSTGVSSLFPVALGYVELVLYKVQKVFLPLDLG